MTTQSTQNAPRTHRVGIAGFGYIGRYVYDRMLAEPAAGLAPAFIWNRSAERLARLPETLVLDDLAQAAERRARSDRRTGAPPDYAGLWREISGISGLHAPVRVGAGGC